jgi:NAD(P)-dependent dehydrogenase (short-subunit alcohol dehydrogenase family)
VEKWGRLDCAVNNAGIAGILGASLADYPDDIFDKVISVNLKGVFLCMKHQINQMLTQDSGGAIVNVASAAGLIGLPNAAYTASKHGVVGMTKSAAIAYSKNRIRINSVCPGYIDTPAIAPALNAGEEVANALVAMHPIGRLGEADEIAEAIAWLCSDAASFMAGHAMAVDGGLVAK